MIGLAKGLQINGEQLQGGFLVFWFACVQPFVLFYLDVLDAISKNQFVYCY